MPLHADELIPTRATLIERLKDWQDQSSWQEFFDTYWKLIYSVARRAGLNDSEGQDVVQETMVAIAKHLPNFKYDPAIGSFKTWLLNMTRWRVIDQLRKRGRLRTRPLRVRGADAGTVTDTINSIPEPTSAVITDLWEAEWQTNLLEAAIRNVKRRVDPHNYQIFDCYVNKNWAVEKVATSFGVPAQHVYLAKHRVTEMIKDEVKRLEKEMT